MSKIIRNEQLSKDFYLLEAEWNTEVKIGQFFMLRGWEDFPVLSRPISVFDAQEGVVSFVYKVVGKGTELISRLKAGEEIGLDGPLGNGFPENISGKVALVGGGVGIAPLYFAAKKYKELGVCESVDIYLGFSDETICEEAYKGVADNLTIDIGGYITDKIDPTKYDYIMTCGPEIMMEVLHKKCVEANAKAKLFVSMENRMACGIGLCKVCTCKNKSGNKTACEDGPVFEGSEVFKGE